MSIVSQYLIQNSDKFRKIGTIVSKNIDTISQIHRMRGIRRWYRRFFQSDAAASRARCEPNSPSLAPAMLMASRDIGPLVNRTAERLSAWQSRSSSSRRRLIELDDQALKDIGISRCDAEHEYRKPFWRP
jgi:uncharacterized protein YjiS (DUF1127 family)